MPRWGILNGVMPQSLSAVYIHLVFSTKDRRTLLRDKPTRDALHSYLGGVSKQLDCPPRDITVRPPPLPSTATISRGERASDAPSRRPNG